MKFSKFELRQNKELRANMYYPYHYYSYGRCFKINAGLECYCRKETQNFKYHLHLTPISSCSLNLCAMFICIHVLIISNFLTHEDNYIIPFLGCAILIKRHKEH